MELFSGRIKSQQRRILALPLLILVAFALSGCYNLVSAAPDKVLNYQGKLTDQNDVVKADGNYSIKFTIWDAESNGNCLWSARGTCGTPTAKTVATLQGIFSTLLGEAGDNAIDLTFNSNYWLQLQVGSDNPMTPRRQISASGYAINSGLLNGQAESAFALLSGRSGGQILIGGTGNGDDLTFQTTSDAAKGSYIFSELGSGLVLSTSGTLSAVANTLHAQNTDTGTTGASFIIASATDAAANDITLQFGGTNSETLYFDGDGTDNFKLSDDLDITGGLVVTDDLIAGSASLAAPFSVDVSGNIVRIGDADTSNNAFLEMYGADGDTGSLEYTANDSWYFSGGEVGIGTNDPAALLAVSGSNIVVDITGGGANIPAINVNLTGSSATGLQMTNTSGQQTNLVWKGTSNGGGTTHYNWLMGADAGNAQANNWFLWDLVNNKPAFAVDGSTGNEKFFVNAYQDDGSGATFQVNGNSNFGGSGTFAGQITTRIAATQNQGDFTMLRFGTDQDFYYDFSRNDTNGRMAIQGNQTGYNDIVIAPTSGNVGIGIGSSLPGAKLDVLATTEQLRLGYDIDSYVKFNVADTTSKLTLETAEGTRSMVTIGKGTAQDAGVSFDGNTNDYYVGMDDTDDAFHIGVGQTIGTTPAITVLSDGKVGLGDITPAYGSLVAASGVAIGSDANANALIDDSTNGAGSTVLYIGQNTINTTAPSDERLKQNISSTDLKLAQLLSLRVVDFQYIPEFTTDQSLHHGLLAQEVEAVYPYAVSERSDGFKMINYDRFTPLIIESIQEQQTAIAGISNSEFLISNQIPSLNDRISQINLKTSENISTLSELQDSVDIQLGTIETSLSEISNNQAKISSEISNLKSQISNQDLLIATLQAQITDLQAKLNTETNLAQVDLNTQDAQFIKLILGTDRVKNPEDVDILGRLSAKTVAAGGMEITVMDLEAPTIGEVSVLPVEMDEDKDGVDDKTESDGQSAVVKTKAVTKDSKIFTNFENNPNAFSWTEKTKKDSEYNGFKIKLSQPVEKEIKVNWWIVEAK